MNSQDALAEARQYLERYGDKDVARLNSPQSSDGRFTQGEAIQSAWEARMLELWNSGRENAMIDKMKKLLNSRGWYDALAFVNMSKYKDRFYPYLHKAALELE